MLKEMTYLLPSDTLAESHCGYAWLSLQITLLSPISVQFLWAPFPFPIHSLQDVCQPEEAALLGVLHGLQRERSSHLQLQTGQPPQCGCGEERHV